MASGGDRRDQGMTRLFRYVLVSDTGIAPCIDDGLTTLAVCKPTVRRSARHGDWVAGFLPKPHPRGLIAYAGRVSEVLDVGTYEKVHRGRSDALYRMLENGSFERLRPEYHPEPDAIRKDLSGPVLIFDKSATWYFGDRPQVLPEELSHLAAAGRGHRVRGASEQDIAALESWLRSIWPPGIHGRSRVVH